MFLFPFEDVHTRNHESFPVNFRSSPVTIDDTSRRQRVVWDYRWLGSGLERTEWPAAAAIESVSAKTVKSGRVCDGCLPSKLGKCQNTSNTHAPDTTPLPIAPTPIPTTENVATAPVAGSTDHENNYSLGLTLGSVDNSPEHILEADPELEPTPTLPEFTPMAVPTFNWGPLSVEAFTASLNSAYSEIVHWRPNLFIVPYGNIGKTFVLELSRLFKETPSNLA